MNLQENQLRRFLLPTRRPSESDEVDDDG